MTADEFFSHSEAAGQKNIFTGAGSEIYLLDEIRDRLLKYFDVPFPEMNVNIFRDKVTYQELETAVLQAPAFSPARIVILDRIDIWEKSLKFSEILDILPFETKLLVLTEKLKAGNLSDRLKKDGAFIEAQSPKAEDLERWLITTAGKEGIKIRNNLARLMIEIAGGDMYTLENELKKLRVLGLTEPREKDIHAIVSGTLEYDIFSFHNFMMAGKYQDAFAVFEKMRKDRDQVMGFIGLLASKFYPMYLARSCIDSGMSNNAAADLISSKTKIKRYPALLAAQDARRFPKDAIKRSLRKLEEIDHLVKTGNKLNEYRTEFLKVYNVL